MLRNRQNLYTLVLYPILFPSEIDPYLAPSSIDSIFHLTQHWPAPGGVLALDLLSFGAGVAMELLAAPFEAGIPGASRSRQKVSLI